MIELAIDVVLGISGIVIVLYLLNSLFDIGDILTWDNSSVNGIIDSWGVRIKGWYMSLGGGRDPVGEWYTNLMSGRDPTITSNIIYNTETEKYLNVDLINTFAYWDTTNWYLMRDDFIEQLNYWLAGEKPEKTTSSMLSIFTLIELEVENILIVPSIHYKRAKAKHDFLNGYKFDKVGT